MNEYFYTQSIAMKTCIICRKEKEEINFNDEHVIPDSIGGYYHIKSVCVDCNSNMGSHIDNLLTNHKFIEFQRHTHGIKGKSGKTPNPFRGTHTLKEDPTQKVKLELNEEGQFEMKLLPKIPKIIADNFTITIDKKDEKEIDIIINKFLERNGIPKDKVKIGEYKHNSLDKPWVETSLSIDIKEFKMGILKIAYEFAVDQIPQYFNDPEAIKISDVLKTVDFKYLHDRITFIGDGLNKEILKPFNHLIDFENKNHYLILFDSPDLGLIVFVNLFNVFNLAIRLSEKSGFVPNNMIVGKNDIAEKRFTIYDMNKLVSHTYSPIEYRFKYFIPHGKPELANDYLENNRNPNFNFYREDGQIPFYGEDGKIKYKNIEDKLQQEQLSKIPSGDDINDIITDIHLDEELYIKLLPINKLFQVVSVRVEQHRKNKL